MHVWQEYYHRVEGLFAELVERTGWSDRRILDAYFASSASEKLLDPDAAYDDQDIKAIIACDRHDESPALNHYPEVYAYILLVSITLYCLEHDAVPSELYEKGRGSGLFRWIEEDSDIFGHYDPEENYRSLERPFSDILIGIDFFPEMLDFEEADDEDLRDRRPPTALRSILQCRARSQGPVHIRPSVLIAIYFLDCYN